MVENDLGALIKSLINTEEAANEVLPLDVDPTIGYDFGLLLFRGETKIKLNMHQEYK